MEIIKTIPGGPDFQLFETLPAQLYNAGRIQPEEVHTSFMHACYILLDKGAPKARAVLYQNPGLFYQGKHAVAIGHYESVDDETVSKKFLEHLSEEAKKLNAGFLIGPMNGSTWDNYRFSLHNDYANFLFEPYHHTYYNRQFLSAGFKAIAHYSSRINSDFFCDHDEVLMKENKLIASGLKIRNINLSNFEAELERLHPFIDKAFQNNFLFSPISLEAFLEKYKKVAALINPEFVLIAEDAKGKIVGFIFCYDNLLSQDKKSLVIKTLARDPSKQWSGLGSVLANQVIRRAKRQRYQSVIHAFMMEDGHSLETSKTFFGNIYKEYVLYGLAL